jgi:hypothetical protein
MGPFGASLERERQMSLGALTIIEETSAGNGGPRYSRCTLVGDGAYPAGGSLGLGIKFRQTTKQAGRKILDVKAVGNNGDAHLEYISPGPALDATVDAATDLFTASSAHGFSAGDAVEFEFQDHGIVLDAMQPPIAANTLFYVIASGLTATAFKVSATSGGASIDVAKSGSLKVRKSDKLLVRVGSTGIESGVANQSGTTYGLLITSY